MLTLECPVGLVESGTYDVICQFCTVKGMVVESEVLKAQNCALSKFILPMHSNGALSLKEKSPTITVTRFFCQCHTERIQSLIHEIQNHSKAEGSLFQFFWHY